MVDLSSFTKLIESAISVLKRRTKETQRVKVIPMKQINNTSQKYDNLTPHNEIIWTRNEKLLFWKVINAHILRLLTDENLLNKNNNEVDINFTSLDPTSKKDLRHCYAIVRKHLWEGNYRTAIWSYRIIQQFFEIICGENRVLSDEHKELMLIFLTPYIS